MITLDALEGRWRLERDIEDARAGVSGRLEGEAIWRADAQGFVQEESGLLHYADAAPMQATRRYLWRAGETGIDVFFEDGRPFHTLPADGEEALHHCAPDLYRVTYTFTGPAEFTQIWHVTGPRKAARIASRFTRL